MFSFTQKLAYKQIRAPQKGSFVPFASILAVLGLSIGITALIITFSALEGFERTVSEKLTSFDGHLRIQHYFDQSIDLKSYPADSIHSNVNVPFNSFYYIESPALLRKGARAEGALVLGLENDRVHKLNDMMVEGESDLQKGNIIIGDRLSELLSVDINDDVALMDFTSFSTLGSPTRLRSFKISGIFHSGLFEYDKSLIYMSLNDAQSLFGMRDQIHGEVYFLNDIEKVKNVEKSISDSVQYPYFVSTWKDKHQILFDWMNVQKWPILAIFGMISFVGLVNIMSGLTMIVLEKMRETGILLALGLKRTSVMKVFIIEGIFIGLAGAAAGYFLAFFLIWLQEKFHLIKISEDIYFMDRIPLEMDYVALAYIAGFSILASILAAWIPSLKAKNVSPAKALRYE